MPEPIKPFSLRALPIELQQHIVAQMSFEERLSMRLVSRSCTALVKKPYIPAPHQQDFALRHAGFDVAVGVPYALSEHPSKMRRHLRDHFTSTNHPLPYHPILDRERRAGLDVYEHTARERGAINLAQLPHFRRTLICVSSLSSWTHGLDRADSPLPNPYQLDAMAAVCARGVAEIGYVLQPLIDEVFEGTFDPRQTRRAYRAWVSAHLHAPCEPSSDAPARNARPLSTSLRGRQRNPFADAIFSGIDDLIQSKLDFTLMRGYSGLGESQKSHARAAGLFASFPWRIATHLLGQLTSPSEGATFARAVDTAFSTWTLRLAARMPARPGLSQLFAGSFALLLRTFDAETENALIDGLSADGRLRWQTDVLCEIDKNFQHATKQVRQSFLARYAPGYHDTHDILHLMREGFALGLSDLLGPLGSSAPTLLELGRIDL